LEAACGLTRLIDRGSLSGPQRSIRFLWVPEISGTYAYCSEHEAELENWVAGLNLDMVGADQGQTGSIFMVERPPAALPSFAPDLLERLREELFDDVADLGALRRYPLFRYGATDFTGGSDHLVLSDPTVGVPTPMLIQWPDRYWHTSADTPDKVDIRMLGRAAVLAAAYAYWLAGAGHEEAYWLGQEMTTRFDERLSRRAQDAIGEGMSSTTLVQLAKVWKGFLRQAEFMHGRQLAALGSLERLSFEVRSSQRELASYANASLSRQKERVQSSFVRHSAISDFDELAPPTEDPELWQEELARLVPRRLYRGPLSVRAHLSKLPPEDRLSWYRLAERAGGGWTTAQRMAQYWADGQRPLEEIVELVELESGRRRAQELLQCFRLWEKMGLVALDEIVPPQP
jgi:hypothetical protein